MSEAAPTQQMSAVEGNCIPRHRLASVGRFVRRELRRHALSERERIIADALLDVSFTLGLRSVRIPKLEVISDLTGIQRSHVHGALKSLFEMRIVTVEQKEGLVVYSINPDTESWKVKIRIPRPTIRRAIEVIKSCNNMDGTPHEMAPDVDFDLGGDPENFKVLADTPLFANRVPDSVTVTDSGMHFAKEFPNIL